ncbi:MAG: hypothetical protein WAO98_03485 [Alphaproteobacteria bacterium]
MLDFEIFIARHGEVAAQAIVENIERYEGVRNSNVISLEQRWHRVMQPAFEQQRLAA